MLATIDAHESFIADAAHNDPTPPMYATFDGAVQYLRASLPALRTRLEELVRGDE